MNILARALADDRAYATPRRGKHFFQKKEKLSAKCFK